MATATLELRADSRQVRTATRDLRGLERQGKDTERVASSLRTAFAALGGVLAVQSVIRYADAYTSVQNQLRIVTSSTSELVNIQAQLLDVANSTRSELESTAGLYATLARNTTELGLSQERLVRITDIINKSFAASGASAQEAAGAIRQLSQGLAAGALRGDEFNSVAEGAPEILRAVAAETGKTIGQLREFAAEGGITAELLIRSLENYGDTVDEIFEKSQRTFGQSLTVANNNLTTFIGELNSGSDAIGTAGDAIVALSENLDELVAIGGTLAALYGSRVVSSIAASTQAKIADTAAAVRQNQASARAAAAEANYLRVVQRSLVAQLQSSKVTAQQTRLRQQLAANTTALTAAQSRANTVMTAGTVAARGLSGAMALVGGPVGAAILASYAIYEFVTSIETAEEKQSSYKNSVSELADEFERLSDNALGTKLKQAQQDYNALNEESLQLIKEEARLIKERDQALAEGGATAAVDEQRALREVQKALEDNEQARAALQKVIDAGFQLRMRETEAGFQSAESSNANSTAVKEEKSNFESLAQSLRAQIIEYEIGKEAGDEYRLMSQLNAGATREEAEALLELKAQLRASAEASREAAEAEAQRKRDTETGKTIGLSDEAEIQQQLNQQLIELERLKNEGLLSETESYTERRNNLIAEANERLAALNEEQQLVDWESFGNRAAGAFASVASGAQTGEEAVRGLAISIAQEAIGALIQMGIQAAVTNATTQASSTAAVATTAAASTSAAATTAATSTAIAGGMAGLVAGLAGTVGAAWAPAAALASLATAGANAVPAQAAIVSTVGVALAAQAVGGLLSNAITAATGFAPDGLSGGRRQGGQVLSGNSYLVGEDGPEMVTMGGGGRVTPFNQLMQSKGGETNLSVELINKGEPMQARVTGERTEFTAGQERRIVQISLDAAVNDITRRQRIPSALSGVGNYQNRAK